MTSATQSNSGASAYIGFLYAFLEKQEGLTLEELHDPDLKKNITELLGAVERSSGSMTGEGQQQLKEAMKHILDQEYAKKNLLQAKEEINIAILFDDEVLEVYTAEKSGAEALKNLYQKIADYDTHGGTDIYGAVAEAMKIASGYELEKYTPAVILMTDGCSIKREWEFENAVEKYNLDIPVFSITFGDADTDQLETLAKETTARVFDGRKDLIAAFRNMKGYN